MFNKQCIWQRLAGVTLPCGRRRWEGVSNQESEGWEHRVRSTLLRICHIIIVCLYNWTFLWEGLATREYSREEKKEVCICISRHFFIIIWNFRNLTLINVSKSLKQRWCSTNCTVNSCEIFGNIPVKRKKRSLRAISRQILLLSSEISVI